MGLPGTRSRCSSTACRCWRCRTSTGRSRRARNPCSARVSGQLMASPAAPTRFTSSTSKSRNPGQLGDQCRSDRQERRLPGVVRGLHRYPQRGDHHHVSWGSPRAFQDLYRCRDHRPGGRFFRQRGCRTDRREVQRFRDWGDRNILRSEQVRK